MNAAARRPEAIDSHLVFLIYACAALPAGLLAYMWPLIVPVEAGSLLSLAITRIVAATVVAAGCCAAASAEIDDPVGRRRALIGFAHAHILFGVMVFLQWYAILSPRVPAAVGMAPFVIGVVLLYLALTGPGADLVSGLPLLEPLSAHPATSTFAVRNKPAAIARLRSQYELQIREAARQEERARLARDLHDAVKQQLFVIQTAGATAQARLDGDPPGARAAVEQVRTAAREAMTEMEAMLDQLQASPIENAGLVAFLRKQCDALGFRTGAAVSFELGTLPANNDLEPGARQAIARVAQEALSNVARHARATRVVVSLGVTDGRLVLTVTDNGGGFSIGGRPRGMGMANIAARASEIGGSVDVVSTPGEGTTVRFAAPCRTTPPARPYAIRAAIWTVVLAVAATLASRAGTLTQPWLAAAGVIAAIAVARYVVAAYVLVRRSA